MSLHGTAHYGDLAYCVPVGKKAYTSKRVSVIAPYNVISKAKLCDVSPGRVTF